MHYWKEIREKARKLSNTLVDLPLNKTEALQLLGYASYEYINISDQRSQQ
jgi:hypothetical protein